MKGVINSVIVLIFVVTPVSCAHDVMQTDLSSNKQLSNAFRQIYNILSNNFGQNIRRSLYAVKLSLNCSQSLKTLFANTEEEWTLKMLESSGRLPIGLYSGTTTSFGDFDQCLTISGRLNDRGKTHIRGKHCFLNIRPKSDQINRENTQISNGICIPSLCSQTEITLLLRKVFSKTALNISVEHCSEETNRLSFNWSQLISIVFVAFSLINVIIGTIIVQVSSHGNDDQNSSKIKIWFKSFSLPANVRKVFAINEKSNENEFAFLDGLRAILCVWVAVSHIIFFPMSTTFKTSLAIGHMNLDSFKKQLFVQILERATLAVQTFLLISGFVYLHSTLKQGRIKPLKANQFVQSVIFRWARFIPVILASLSILFIMSKFGSGPLFHHDFSGSIFDPCYRNWLLNVLLINNWWSGTKQCLSHTWYLSTDFQINIFAYFLFIYFTKDYNKAFVLNVVLIIVGIILPIMFGYIFKLPVDYMLEPNREKHGIIYARGELYTYNNIAAFFTGSLVAAIINRDPDFKLSSVTGKIGWFMCLVAMVFCLFSNGLFMKMNQIHNDLLTAACKPILRITWVVANGWLIFACSTFDKNGFISRVLSAKVFKPFSKLSFSAYLVNPLIVYYQMYSTRQLILNDYWSMLFRSGGMIFMTFFLGLVFHVVFEAPTANLIKAMVQAKKETETVNNDINENDIRKDDKQKHH